MYLSGVKKSHFIEQVQDQELLIDFHELLKEKLYLTNIQAVEHKYELEYYVKPCDVDIALHKKFIKFGTKQASNFIVIDIDNCNYTLDNFKNIVSNTLDGYNPSWILKSNNGFHIGFIMEQTVFFNNTNEVEKFNTIKKLLSILFNADRAGSLRKSGFWRNSLTHQSYHHLEKHNIDELLKHINRMFSRSITLFDSKQSIENKFYSKNQNIKDFKNKNWNEISKKGFVESNRNNYLFKTTVGMLYNGKINKSEILSTLISLNQESLQLSELTRIARSIERYNIKAAKNKKNEDKHFVYTKGIYWEDMRLNDIHNYKKNGSTIYARQKLGQSIRTAKVISSTTERLLKSYLSIYKSSSKKFTNKNIITNSNLSKRTIQRYRNDRNLEKEIKATAFKIYILELSIVPVSNKRESVIAKDTLCMKLKNIAIKDIDFINKKTQYVYVFSFTEKNKLVFNEKVNISDKAA